MGWVSIKSVLHCLNSFILFHVFADLDLKTSKPCYQSFLGLWIGRRIPQLPEPRFPSTKTRCVTSVNNGHNEGGYGGIESFTKLQLKGAKVYIICWAKRFGRSVLLDFLSRSYVCIWPQGLSSRGIWFDLKGHSYFPELCFVCRICPVKSLALKLMLQMIVTTIDLDQKVLLKYVSYCCSKIPQETRKFPFGVWCALNCSCC